MKKIKNFKDHMLGVGAPGVGKSDIMKSIAKKMGHEYVDLRASNEPVDFSGIPTMQILRPVFEVDENHDLTNAKLKLSKEEIDDLVSQDLIFYDFGKHGLKNFETFFFKKDREKIEEFIAINRGAKKFNL